METLLIVGFGCGVGNFLYALLMPLLERMLDYSTEFKVLPMLKSAFERTFYQWVALGIAGVFRA